MAGVITTCPTSHDSGIADLPTILTRVEARVDWRNLSNAATGSGTFAAFMIHALFWIYSIVAYLMLPIRDVHTIVYNIF